LWRLIPENERSLLLSAAPHFRQRHIERILKGRAHYQPCFDRHRALFIHVPKSAGRSIVRGLFDVRSVEHAPADWYQLLDSEKFDAYFKFTFVRNPWDRAVSAYTYLLQGGSAASVEDRQWSRFVSGFENFDDFARNWLTPDNVMRYALFTPQVEFLKNRFGQIDMDFIGRFETLADDFATVAKRLGVDATLPHINSSRDRGYQDFYSEASHDAVARAYAEDIASLDYRFEQ
jgi:hypothetical protein